MEKIRVIDSIYQLTTKPLTREEQEQNARLLSKLKEMVEQKGVIVVTKEPEYAIGDKVRHRTEPGLGGVPTTEYGIVVARWWEVVMCCWCYYVAFYGMNKPRDGHKPQKPYVLNYLDVSLERGWE